jgi:predicted nucleic acid-binding protein
VQVYLDASAVLPLFVTDSHTSIMEDWAADGGFTIILSDFAAAEVCAAVSRSVRTGRLELGRAEAVLADFDRWKLQTYQQRTAADNIAECERLVREFRLKLTAPDALHIALARAAKVPLVTFDERLAAATRATGYPAIVPGRDV